MTPAPSRDVDTLHRAELEAFTTELIAAGFHPEGSDRTIWIGPVHPRLAHLSEANPTEMRILLRAGWPYQHPYIFVDGLVGRTHVNPFGNVCLWEETDANFDDWRSLEAINARIEAWCDDQAQGAPDLSLDAHLYYAPMDTQAIVLIDIDRLEHVGAIELTDGAMSELHATLTDGVYRVAAYGPIRVAWFWRDSLSAPPSSLDRIEQALTDEQAAELTRLKFWVRPTRPCLVLLGWNEAGTVNALAIRISRQPHGGVLGTAIELARTDASVMLLRSGRDSSVLASKSAAVFGIGAIGSEIAVLLARSGVGGGVMLTDSERLRPGNLTRHAADGRYVGMPKAQATARTIQDALPHIVVAPVAQRAWDPAGLSAIAGGMSVLIDATGNHAFADMLSMIAATASVAFVSAALFRAGAVAMVDIQPSATSLPVALRRSQNGFPSVPSGADDQVPLGRETGCGAPVNNAPPWSVSAAGALAAQCVIDVLCGRSTADERLFSILQPLEVAPFDERGLRRFSANG